MHADAAHLVACNDFHTSACMLLLIESQTSRHSRITAANSVSLQG